MGYKEMLEIAIMVVTGIAFICLIVFTIQDIIESNKYWRKMKAELDLYRTVLHKEHDLLKKVQAYGEWLDNYHALMHTNVKLEDNEFNNGTLTAAGDCLGEFLNTMGEYVDGKESSD